MTNSAQSVWITGMGVLGPQALSVDGLHESVRNPRLHFSRVPEQWLEQKGCPPAYLATLPAEAAPIVKAHETVSTDRACALALVAAEQAWSQASANATLRHDPYRSGVYWGTGMGGLHSTEMAYQRLLVTHQPMRPMTVVRIMANSSAAQIAITHQLKGPNQTYSVACASSAMALGEAMLAIQAGRIDLAIVGGSEAMLAPGVLAAWGALQVLSTEKSMASADLASRPFSSERKGLVIGEGACAFVLESERHARARGATPLAELVGYGTSCDAASLVHPKVDGQVVAMRLALAHAGITPEQVDAINAHATGTDAGDLVEVQALGEVFGQRIPPISATKSQHGHLLGAAGAMEAAVCVSSLQQGLIPATLNANPIDPRCAHLDLAVDKPRPADLNHVLSNSFAFGGTNVTLVLKRAGKLPA